MKVKSRFNASIYALADSHRIFGVTRKILLVKVWSERAFISTYQKIGYIQDDKLLVLGSKKEADYFSFDRKNGATVVLKPQENLLIDALAYI
jgi:hypothetical protein